MAVGDRAAIDFQRSHGNSEFANTAMPPKALEEVLSILLKPTADNAR
jgi:hypothetical protein